MCTFQSFLRRPLILILLSTMTMQNITLEIFDNIFWNISKRFFVKLRCYHKSDITVILNTCIFILIGI